jgi:hypothetical protein
VVFPAGCASGAGEVDRGAILRIGGTVRLGATSEDVPMRSSLNGLNSSSNSPTSALETNADTSVGSCWLSDEITTRTMTLPPMMCSSREVASKSTSAAIVWRRDDAAGPCCNSAILPSSSR